MGSTMNQLARLREAMSASHVSAYICRNNSDLFWLTALDGIFDEEQAHCAVVTAQEAILHTDSRYINAFDACRRRGLAPGWSFTTKPPCHSAFLTSVLAPLCAGIPGKVRVGIEANLPLNIYRAWVSAFEGLVSRWSSSRYPVSSRACVPPRMSARLPVSRRRNR